jgi:hypothetical protein
MKAISRLISSRASHRKRAQRGEGLLPLSLLRRQSFLSHGRYSQPMNLWMAATSLHLTRYIRRGLSLSKMTIAATSLLG